MYLNSLIKLGIYKTVYYCTVVEKMNQIAKHLFILACLISLSLGLQWPKIYKDDMVLQASPTTAVLWGFLDGNQNPVEMTGECVLNGKSKKLKSTFVPKQVRSIKINNDI